MVINRFMADHEIYIYISQACGHSHNQLSLYILDSKLCCLSIY